MEWQNTTTQSVREKPASINPMLQKIKSMIAKRLMLTSSKKMTKDASAFSFKENEPKTYPIGDAREQAIIAE